MAKGPVSKIGGAHAPSGFESQRLRHQFKDTCVSLNYLKDEVEELNAIEIENLTKRFKNHTVLDSIYLNVEDGKCFSLIGPNGAGKSTLIKILTTLLKPSSGKVLIFGHPLKDRKSIRKRIALVSENTVFYDQLSALENLLFFAGLYHVPKKIAKYQAEKLLKMVEMWRWRDKPIKSFSTGMRQRINLVRGLMHSPDLLFLDEPTLALDPQTSNIIIEAIKDIKKKGITVFFTSHIMKNVEDLADEIAVINEGKIIFQGSLAELKSNFTSSKREMEISFESESQAWQGYEILKDLVKNDINVKKRSILLSLREPQLLRDVLFQITKNGLSIKDVNTHSSSLEKIFIELTTDNKKEKR